MGVEVYETRLAVLLHAGLWKGKMADLVGMPDFNDLVGRVVSIDGKGDLIFEGEKGDDTMAVVGQHYIVRGVTGHFFIMGVAEFEKTYVVRPSVVAGPIKRERRDEGNDIPMDRL